MQKLSKRLVWFVLLLGFVVAGAGCKKRKAVQKEKAESGVLDLRNSDFSRNYTLNGEWSFYWKELLQPGSKARKSASQIKVPGSWTRHTFRGKKLPRQGYATYRLTVKLPKERPSLMLNIHRVTSAYELWVNGKPLASQGKVGRTLGSSAMSIQSQMVPLPPGRTLELLLHVSNFRHRVGGVRRPWTLGPTRLMLSGYQKRSFYEGVLPAIILSVGLMFLALGGVRRIGSWLWFGMFCLTVGIRTSVGNESTAMRVMLPWFDTASELRLEYISIFWILACIFGLFSWMFPKQSPRRSLVWLCIAIFFSFAIGSALMPLHWVLHSLPLFGALGVLAVCYSYWIVLKAWRESENLAGLILLGLLISSVAFFHDIARAMGFIAAPVEIAPASFLCLIFIQTYALVQRFAESFDQIRELSEQLQTAHNALQQSHTQLQKNHEVVLMELEEARQLGNYQLEEMLGAGGMGEVWRASHRLLARPAAIKLVLAEKFDQSDEQRRLRFEREAQATAQLRSPHTVELYDYGCSPKGEFYYAMELLDGLDLAGFVEHYGPMPAARVIHLLHQACLSLAEAHGQGLIHRDIKPANLFLCRVGVEFDFLKILDFGLVKAQTASETLRHEEPAWPDEVPSDLLDSFDNAALSSYETLDASSLHTNSSQGSLSSQNLTIAGMITGTPAYMSPEQITGRSIDGRSDLYALACVAYWLLSARAVFPGDEPATLLFQHMTMEVSPLEKVCKQPVPAELSELILDCLSKSPKDRPKNAIVLLERLEHMRKKYPWTNEEAREWWIRHQPDKKRALETQETLV